MTLTIISRRGTRSALSLLAATAATVTVAPAALAAGSSTPTNARDCVEADLVWVSVDFDDSTNKGGCATEFGSGAEALESAGFTPNFGSGNKEGFLVGINDVIPVWEETQTYWGSWYGTVAADGSIAYNYYQVGALQSEPKPGSIEAWSVGDGSQQPSLKQLPDASQEGPSSSSDKSLVTGIAAVIAAILAVAGGIFAAVNAGLVNIPGLANLRF